MALTEQEKILQVGILTDKTDKTTNPGMTYSSVPAMNKGLNPNYFTGYNTKIVNAMNTIMSETNTVKNNSFIFSDKVNNILLDIETSENLAKWNGLQEKMGKPTIIEGLDEIMSGNSQDRLLQLNKEDAGKVLSVHVDDVTGKAVTKAITLSGSGGPVSATDVQYTNENLSDVTNVAEAIDHILTHGSTTVDWADIQNRPEIIDNIELTPNELILVSNGAKVSSVAIISDADIDSIFTELNMI